MGPFTLHDGNNGSTMENVHTSPILPDADEEFIRFRNSSRFWIQKVLLPLIGTVGIFGNIATILVLSRRGMRSSTNTYLTALAVADLIYLICVIWLSLRHYPSVNDNPTWSFIYSHIWPYSLWLADATTNTSVWLAVTFTVERCAAIAYPTKRRMLSKISRAKKVICFVYLICFTTTMTTPFEWTVEKNTNPMTNTSIYEIATSHLGKEKTYQTIYYWFTSITFVLLPLSLLIIFNSYLIHSFRQSQHYSRRMAAQQNNISEREEEATTRELNITSTLITVVIMFIVCQIPTAVTLIYEIFHVSNLTPNEEAVLRALGNIFNCLVALNAACNFILYCALSAKYRKTFMLTFFPCLYKPSDSSNLKALFPLQAQGTNAVAQFRTRRHYSVSTRGHRSLMPLNDVVPNQRFCVGLQNTPSPSEAKRRKPNSNVTVALPVISENGEPHELFTTSNSSRVVVIHNFSAMATSSPCSQHQSSRFPMWRSANFLKRRRSVDQSSLDALSWPIIKPYYPSVTVILLDTAESRDHFVWRSATKKCVMTSFSV